MPAACREILVEAVLENALDSGDAARRRVEVSEALVDPEFLGLALPRDIIQRLGLVQFGTRKRRTSRGVQDLKVFCPVILWVQGRDCLSEVLEWPEETRIRIGRLPLLVLDYVIDHEGGRLIGNPDHGGEQMIDLF